MLFIALFAAVSAGFRIIWQDVRHQVWFRWNYFLISLFFLLFSFYQSNRYVKVVTRTHGKLLLFSCCFSFSCWIADFWVKSIIDKRFLQQQLLRHFIESTSNKIEFRANKITIIYLNCCKLSWASCQTIHKSIFCVDLFKSIFVRFFRYFSLYLTHRSRSVSIAMGCMLIDYKWNEEPARSLSEWKCDHFQLTYNFMDGNLLFRSFFLIVLWMRSVVMGLVCVLHSKCENYCERSLALQFPFFNGFLVIGSHFGLDYIWSEDRVIAFSFLHTKFRPRNNAD